jgi:tetratricopeptide (TPR) repeat protein
MPSRCTSGREADEIQPMSSRFRTSTIRCLLGFALAWTPLAFAQTSPKNSNELQVISPAKQYPEIAELVRANKWKDVIALTGELHRADPADPTVLYWAGTAHLQLHEPTAAVQAFRSAERLGLDTALLHVGLGLAYYDLNQFGLFQEQMKKSAAWDPNDSKPYYYLGFYQWTIRSDPSAALDFFDKAIHLAPDDWKSVYQSGNCLEQLGRLDDARSRYETAIGQLNKSGAQFGWPYQGMARLLLDENPQRALELAKKAVQLEPEEPSNHLTLADVYQRLENLQEAIQEAQIAISKNPNDSKAHYALFKLYRQADDPRAKSELDVFKQTKALYDSN